MTSELKNPEIEHDVTRAQVDNFRKKEYNRFLHAYQGNAQKALKRLRSAAPFRIQHEAPLVYSLTFDKFSLIKKLYVHKFIRSSHPKHRGTCILIDNVGSFNRSLKAFRREGISDDDVMEHATFLMSYFLTHIDPRDYPDGRIIRVFDLSGFKLKHMSNIRALRLGLRLTFLAEKYFPERLKEIIVVNAHPFAIGVFNRLIRSLLHERTREKFQFFPDDLVLREFLGPEQIDWQSPEHTSAEEVALIEFVQRRG